MKKYLKKASALFLATVMGFSSFALMSLSAENMPHEAADSNLALTQNREINNGFLSMWCYDVMLGELDFNVQMDIPAMIFEEVENGVFTIDVNELVDEHTESFDEQESYLGIEPITANLFSWSNMTTPFVPQNMQATTDADIVWDKFASGQFDSNFDLWGTGLGSMFANLNFNANSHSDFINFRNEGHINDFFGIFGQPHTYVSLNSINPYITVFAGHRVRVLVFTMNGGLVFDSGHGSNGNWRSPAAGASVVAWNFGSTTGFGQSVDYYFLQMQPGNYFVAFMNYNAWPLSPDFMDNLEPGFYYAFYTGMPLPFQRRHSALAHSGTVFRANTSVFSTMSQTREFTLSINPSTRAPWFAINGIQFNISNPSPTGGINVSNVVYEYRAPNSSTFWNSVQSRPLQNAVLTDFNPPRGSIIGTWQFRYIAHWQPHSQVGNLSGFIVTSTVHIDYLVPFGSGL